ncbi:MAG TPA: DUF3179 domain-containing protein [Gaiellaceae bacterium]|nr:DUF3179 domain-containing protein [Gaiellaceae bacterium]
MSDHVSRTRRHIALPSTLVLVALALALVGCGGKSETKDEEELSEALATLEEQLEELGPLSGLGEAEPPPPDASRWKTDFSKRLVPLEEIRSGGPPKDGIPAIDAPRFTSAQEVDWLEGREPVIAVTVGDETRAYPIQILMWHEIVNDELGGTPVAVTFCPLCNTAIVFDRRLDGDVLSFGTTGKLRESDLVMYDRKTESWWQQFSGEAIVGELAGKKLEQLPVRIVAWEDFRKTSPAGPVLNRETGYTRDYGRNPYVGYDSVDSSPIFPVTNEDDDRLPPKERVVYVEVGDRALAVPFPTLAERRVVTAETSKGDLVVRWRPGVASALDSGGVAAGRDIGAAVVTLDGEPVPFTEPFWFVVAAFRPQIEIVGG